MKHIYVTRKDNEEILSKQICKVKRKLSHVVLSVVLLNINTQTIIQLGNY